MAILPIQLQSETRPPCRWWTAFCGSMVASRFRIGMPPAYDSVHEPVGEFIDFFPQSVTFKVHGLRVFNVNIYLTENGVYECDIYPTIVALLLRRSLRDAVFHMTSIGFHDIASPVREP